MHPAIFEALVFALMGVSGVAGGLLLGIRRAIPLTVIGFGLAVTIRTLSAFASWSIGQSELSYELWLGTSVAITSAGLLLHWRAWKTGTQAVALFGALSFAALATKYIFDIGERHHSDSADAVALAIVQIQSEHPNLLELANSPKRGISFPLMLALGPEGRILAGFTPMVFFMVLLLAAWIIKELLGENHRPLNYSIALVATIAFSLSVPIWRASLTYLNSHTLMGLALLMLLSALLLYDQTKSFGALPATLAGLGGVLGATSRIEGILFVAILFAVITSRRYLTTTRDRVRLAIAMAASGLSFVGWIESLDSPILRGFGIPISALAIASTVGAAILASRLIDPARRWILPTVSVVLLAAIFRVILSSGDPISLMTGPLLNLGLGSGGWGTAAYAFAMTIVLVGRVRQDVYYKKALLVVLLVIGGTLFAKSFEGGFGGPGFYDSVNRMWLHLAPLIFVTTVIGYTNLLSAAFSRKQSLSS